MANTGSIRLKISPKNDIIKINGIGPISVAFFSPIVGKESSQGSLSLGEFSTRKNWKQFFEGDNPNSVLAWSEGEDNFQLTFKQGRPKVRKDGSWMIKGKPLFSNKNEKNELEKVAGSSADLNINSSTLMVDSTGDAVSGNVSWAGIENSFDIINNWFKANPKILCDGIEGMSGVLGALGGAISGAAAGAALAGLSKNWKGISLISFMSGEFNVNKIPKLKGSLAEALGGATIGGIEGAAAVSTLASIYSTEIVTSVCELGTGQITAGKAIDNIIEDTEKLFSMTATVSDDIGKAVNTINTISSDATKIIDIF